jgi:acetate kinase
MTCFLIINVGSTSLKSCLFNSELQLLADYHAASSAATINADLTALLQHWRNRLSTEGWTLLAIGHRVVHGATLFTAPTVITPTVLVQLTTLDHYAPLHNPYNRLGIDVAAQFFANVPQFAVFDTAFHSQLPEVARRYALPESVMSPTAFYRYGFHGLSCQHSLTHLAQQLKQPPETLNVIVLHLGGGASITAIRAGLSVDTSMGFSPTEGLLMASRCGDIDPMILIHLQRQGWSAEQLDRLLNQQSGLLGLCGSRDMQDIVQRAATGDEAACLALDSFCYRSKKYLGSYCAILGRVDAVVFTGGIGEHSAIVRQRILSGLEPFGIVLDEHANTVVHEGCLSVAHSRCPVWVIPAQEEREIARQIHLLAY